MAATIPPRFSLLQGAPDADALFSERPWQGLMGLGGNDYLQSDFYPSFLDGGADDDALLLQATLDAQASPGDLSADTHSGLIGGAGADALSAQVNVRELPAGATYLSAPVTLRLWGEDGDDAVEASIWNTLPVSGAFTNVASAGTGDDRINLTIDALDEEGHLVQAENRAYGGDGNDTLLARAFDAGVMTNRLQGDAGDDELMAHALAAGLAPRVMRNVVDGGAGADRILAELIAESATDLTQEARVTGGDGHDVLQLTHHASSFVTAVVDARAAGGGGDDQIEFNQVNQSGRDQESIDIDARLSGDAGDDQITAYAQPSGADMDVFLRLDGGAGDDLLRSALVVSPDVLTGTSGSTLIGGAGDDHLEAQGGRVNVLNGGRGADVMVGGIGDDTYYVDTYRDTVVEGLSHGYDTVRASVSYRLPWDIEQLVLTNLAQRGTGNAFDNAILGNAADNRLIGLEGDDRLGGGGGDDLLEGGYGADTFVIDLRLGDAQSVTIADFDRKADRLEFVGFDAASVEALDQASSFAPETAEIVTEGVSLRFAGLGAVDSYLDLVNDPAQIVFADTLV